MKRRYVHIIDIKGRDAYESLMKVFPDMLKTFLISAKLYDPNDKDGSFTDEYFNTLLSMNLMDIKNKRKPEGFNIPGFRNRLMFPDHGKVEFYTEGDMASQAMDNIIGMLKKKRIKHDVVYEDRNPPKQERRLF
jgi:hypothetical protein